MELDPPQEQEDQEQPVLLRLLRPDEELHVAARASDGMLAVTDRRLVMADGPRVMMDMPFSGLRRIQFDIERGRPATLVVVPQEARATPQVLTVPPEHFDEVGSALAAIGRRLAALD